MDQIKTKEEKKDYSVSSVAKNFFISKKSLFNIADSTISAYSRDYKQFEVFLENKGIPNDVRVVTSGVVEDFLADCKQSGCGINTLNRKKDSLSSMLKYCVKHDLIDSNPIEKVELAPRKKNQRQVFLEIDETKRFLAVEIRVKGYNSDTISAAKLALVTTGGRESEVRNTEWEHIDFEEKFLYIYNSKNTNKKQNTNGLDRVIPMSKPLREALLKLYTPGLTGPVFRNKQNKRLTKDSLSRIVNRSRKAAKINAYFTAQGLRHSLSSHLEKIGATESDRALLLGHSPSSTTMGYTHSSVERVRMLIEKFAEAIFETNNNLTNENCDSEQTDTTDFEPGNTFPDNLSTDKNQVVSQLHENMFCFDNDLLEQAKTMWSKIMGNNDPMTADFLLGFVSQSCRT